MVRHMNTEAAAINKHNAEMERALAQTRRR